MTRANQQNTTDNQQTRRRRINNAEAAALITLETIKKHDLYPLARFLGFDESLLSKIEVDNLFGTENDFGGKDFLMRITDLFRWYIQDKMRASGKDLLLEFCRMYRLDDTLILDGGRDIYRLFGPVEYVNIDGINMVVRDWDNTKTESDLILFHPKGDPDNYWIKPDPVKAIAYDLFEMWKERFLDIENEVKDNCFKRTGRIMFNSHMSSSTRDIHCMQDPDMKRVIMPDGEEKFFSTCKAVVFIPLDQIENLWVKTTLRNP